MQSFTVKPTTPLSAPKLMATPTATNKAVFANDIRVRRQTPQLYRGPVRICVGAEDEQRVFDVHESFLIKSSLFFRKALSGGWLEAKDRLVKLPEEEPAVFQDYVHYLYTNTLCVKSDTKLDGNDGPNEMVSLVKLFVLAETLQDPDMKKVVIAAVYNGLWEIRNAGSKIPVLELISVVYEGTPVGSSMRRLLVDFFTYYAGGSTFRKDEVYPHDFIQELAINLAGKRFPSLDNSPIFKDPSVYVGMATLTTGG